jgi:hypothetical protein
MIILRKSEILYECTAKELDYAVASIKFPEVYDEIVRFLSEGGFNNLSDVELAEHYRETFTDLDTIEFRKQYRITK